jgi:hypothetical protein
MLPALCRALRGAHATARLNAAGTAMNLAVCPANKVCLCGAGVRSRLAPFRPLSSPLSGQPQSASLPHLRPSLSRRSLRYTPFLT